MKKSCERCFIGGNVNRCPPGVTCIKHPRVTESLTDKPTTKQHYFSSSQRGHGVVRSCGRCVSDGGNGPRSFIDTMIKDPRVIEILTIVVLTTKQQYFSCSHYGHRVKVSCLRCLLRREFGPFRVTLMKHPRVVPKMTAAIIATKQQCFSFSQ